MNILIIDSSRVNYLDEKDIVISRFGSSANVVTSVTPTDAQLKEADGIIAFHSVKIDRLLVDKLKNCRAIVKATIGLDDVDIVALNDKKISCANIGSVGAEEVAEHSLALVLIAQRKIMDYFSSTKAGEWNWRAHYGTLKRSSDTTLGIVGYGSTGKALSKKAALLGFKIEFFDPHVEKGEDGAIKVDTLELLLQGADIVSLHLPLSSNNEKLLNDATFSFMKDNSVLINTARGGLVDTDAMMNALNSGKLSAALLDVIAEEPNLPDEVIRSNKVLLTPHCAFYSKKSLEDLKVKAADSLIAMLKGEMIHNIVNPQFKSK